MTRIRYQFLLTLPLSLLIVVLMMIALVVATPLSANPPRTSIATPSHTPDKEETIQPIVLLTIYNPWLMVIGSDAPTFALYDNGLVIYQRLGPADAPEFASVQLTADELKALIDQ